MDYLLRYGRKRFPLSNVTVHNYEPKKVFQFLVKTSWVKISKYIHALINDEIDRFFFFQNRDQIALMGQLRDPVSCILPPAPTLSLSPLYPYPSKQSSSHFIWNINFHFETLYICIYNIYCAYIHWKCSSKSYIESWIYMYICKLHILQIPKSGGGI